MDDFFAGLARIFTANMGLIVGVVVLFVVLAAFLILWPRNGGD